MSTSKRIVRNYRESSRRFLRFSSQPSQIYHKQMYWRNQENYWIPFKMQMLNCAFDTRNYFTSIAMGSGIGWNFILPILSQRSLLHSCPENSGETQAILEIFVPCLKISNLKIGKMSKYIPSSKKLRSKSKGTLRYQCSPHYLIEPEGKHPWLLAWAITWKLQKTVSTPNWSEKKGKIEGNMRSGMKIERHQVILRDADITLLRLESRFWSDTEENSVE